jgi:glycosyltransferase involved in cell wall biosynthesis
MVSVLVPTYNRARWLSRAIASVRAQTVDDWEIVIADDGSTDDTTSVIPADSRIRLIRLPHSGNVAAVRNAGLAAARGEFVGFLDSDDLWRPRKLEWQIERLSHCSDCGWCHGDYRLVNEAGVDIPFRAGGAWRRYEGWFLRDLLTTEANISLQTVMVRRELALQIKFDERIAFGDDYDFLVRLAMISPACAVDTVVASVRDHADRGSRERRDFALSLAMAYRRYGRQLTDRELRHICRSRMWFLVRHHLAQARAAGAGLSGARDLLVAWRRD